MDYLKYNRSNNKVILDSSNYNKIKVIDDLLPKEQFDIFYKRILLEKIVGWSWCDEVDYGKDERFQFVHQFFTPTQGVVSPVYELVEPFVDLLQMESVCRIKANLTTRTENHIEGKFHYDHELAGARLEDGTLIGYTAIYYVNTTNGYTLFQSGEKVKSVANRIVIFDSSKLHKGVTCTDEKRRVVFNFNYFTSQYGADSQMIKATKLFNEANA